MPEDAPQDVPRNTPPDAARASARQALARDNWTQAKSDLATALTLLDAGIYYAAVFWSHQAAEKSLRAACLSRLGRSPRGPGLLAGANALAAPLDVMNAAAELNADFFASRLVESAGGVPAQLYDRPVARRHLDAARLIVGWARGLM